MPDLLRLYVLFHPQSRTAADYAEAMSRHFDGLGMEREGVQYRIPVRFRSDPWGGEPDPAAPRAVALDEAEHNVVVLLHDDYVHADRATWSRYVGDLKAGLDRREGDLLIPFQMNSGTPTLSPISKVQHARQDKWRTVLPDAEARTKRLLLHVLFCLREHLRRLDRREAKEPLFVSHAKADGDPTARAIVDHVNDSRNDVPISTFYDAMELMPGEDFRERFEAEIHRGTLLAIVSDIYDSRPWCIYEMTEAKRARRPIVLADVGRLRTSRTYPYGANLPRVRLSATNASSIEALLVETLSEALRCDLFKREAERVLATHNQGRGVALPRPPELLDIIDRDDLGGVVVYPDPPVGAVEQGILDKALKARNDGTVVKTIEELR